MKRLAPTPWRRLRSVCTPRRGGRRHPISLRRRTYIEGRRETRNGRERMGAAPFLPHMLSTLWSCCCRYLSASMPATHNLFFPHSDANSRKCMSAVDYDGPPRPTTATPSPSASVASSLSPKAKTASRSDVSLWRP